MTRHIEKWKPKRWTNWLLIVGSLLTAEVYAAEEKADAKTEAKAGEKTPAAGAAGATTENAKNENSLFPEKEVYTRAEVEALREVLDKKSNELDLDIDAQVKYMEKLKSQTEDHLKNIETARNEIADFMNTRDEKEEGKLKKLARFYEAMDAEQAAPLLKEVNDELAIKIFDRMDAKKAGTILAQLPAPRAGRLTTAFPKLKLQLDKAQAEAAK